MSTESQYSPEKKLVRTILPWLVAVVALVVYVFTLNPWVSFGSLPQVVKMSGWTWLPELSGPLYWLVTYPIRWLPAQAIPLALNVFTMVCAALTLALLSRSVALLPYDRLRDQRHREHSAFSLLTIPAAWVPPVLAVLVCGLQFSFWQNATVASADMFDLLIFAYAIRCLLEYRVSDRESWLLRASLAFGLGMTNNWAMIGFFPAFLVALVWIKGLSFFDLRFLGRMLICALVGLSLYFVLPLVAWLGSAEAVPFWSALKFNLASQKHALQGIINFCRYYRIEGLLLALPTLVPLIFIGIRWPSFSGDISNVGILVARIIFDIVHGLFLGVLVWIALNPPFTPYSKGYGAFLPYYYLGALSIGYCSGYFLLLFGRSPGRRRAEPIDLSVAKSPIVGLIWLLLLVVPCALLYRNLPQIRVANGPMLKQFASLMAQPLPKTGAVLLSDDSRRLVLLEAYAAQTGRDKQDLFLDTGALALPEYHRFLKKKYSQLWESDPPKSIVRRADPLLLVQIISHLAQTNDVYYLHPSFGYYFEYFYQEPHGLVYKLFPYTTNMLFAPRPSQEVAAENEAFWANAGAAALQPLQAALAPPPLGKHRSLIERLMDRIHLIKEPSREASVLGAFYSRSLDYWGAEMQKMGGLTNAQAHFEAALEMKPDNLVAQINLECNKNLRAGQHKTSVQVPKSIEEEFGNKYRKLEDILSENGPFDEPNFCYEQGRVFVSSSLYRQAAAQFDRVIALAPENLVARIWLSQLYVLGAKPKQALELLSEVASKPEFAEAARTNRTELLFVETSAHLSQQDLRGAEAAVQTSLQRYPNDEGLLAIATQVFMKYGSYFDNLLSSGVDTNVSLAMKQGCYSNALNTIEQELVLSPANTNALVNKGFACLQLGAFERAISPLTKVLALDSTNYPAMLNRAIAYLRSDKLDAAQSDYEVLQKAFPTAFQIRFGLAEIAWRKKDTNAAILNYELYRANAPTNTTEAQLVNERLRELQPGSP
jgi:tetratricopeptide (TPR) repeat protein